MNEEEREVMRISLGVVSGRIESLTDDEYRMLGFDPYKFSYYGYPTLDDVRGICEENIQVAFEQLFDIVTV